MQLLVQRERGEFADVIAAAAADARADVVVVEKRMQGRDHPVLMTVPETVLPEVLSSCGSLIGISPTPPSAR